MRIHRLTLRGVGPFVEEYTLDFDTLAERKLFLIEGVTGAGKSTIIDAIVFALYGDVNEDISDERLVSDFLGPITKNNRPFVELVFTVESGVYRVRREPRYKYVNRNGNDDQQNPTVRLERLVNEAAVDGELITNKIQEGSREIAERLQLDNKQFHSTVVLAQGGFAKFLRATSEDRKQILERVFGTRGYARVQLALENMRKAANDARGTADKALREAAARFVQAAGITDEDGTWVTDLVAEPGPALAAAGERVAELAETQRVAHEQQAAAREALTAAQAANDQAEKRAALVRDKRQVLRIQDRLEAQVDEIEGFRQQVAQHVRALTVEPAITTLADSQQEAELAAAQFAEALAPLGDDPLTAFPEDELAPALRDASGAAEAELGRLEEPAALEKRLPELRDAVADATRAVATAQVELAKCQELKTALPAQLAETAELIGRLEREASRRDDLAEDVKEYETCQQAAKQWAELEDDRAAAAASAAAAHAEFEAAIVELGRVERAYSESLAVQVAGSLIPGEPCPACGSLEHPNPATASTGVAKGAVEQARQHEKEARRGLDDARGGVDRIDLQIASFRTAAKEQDAKHWQAMTGAARAALAAAEDAAQALVQAKKNNEALLQEQSQIHARHNEAAVGSAKAEERATHAENDLAKAERALAEFRGDFATVADRMRSLSVRAKTLSDAAAAHDRRVTANAGVKAARKGLKQALRDNGFGDRQERDAALLSDADHRQRTRTIDKHDRELARVRDWLAHPEHQAADADEVVDTDAPRAAHEAARLGHEESLRALAAAESEHAAARKQLRKLDAACKEMLQVRERTAPVIRMARVAKGENNLSIPLATYVVVRRFEEVVAAANERLQAISDGRYRLEVDTEKGDGRARARGLGLRIVDETTEQARDVKTLSGGETFYTSLSLALGLADVVQSEAGGIQLGTLFIDEGFGSLDGDTLDNVMDVLGKLTHGDRVVGVISHVEEMKRNIQDRVRVRRRDDGTSVIEMPT